MPELPEIEHLRRSLRPSLVGARIVDVRLHRPDVLHTPPPRGSAARWLRDALVGSRVTAIDRLGKYLALRFDRPVILCAHMGMTGQLRVLASDSQASPLDHVHCTWTIERASAKAALMVFRDPRRFGGLWLEHIHQMGQSPASWNHLGPDALTIDGEALSAALAGRKRPIKAALLDQSILAGVGNIYADESLHRAGISPLASCHRLKAQSINALAVAIRHVLTAAVNAGGSSLRDYVDADGTCGSFVHEHAVYGRAGEPCHRCHTALRSTLVAQRTTVWCPACQPANPRSNNAPRLSIRRAALVTH